MDERQVHITVRLGAIALIGLLIVSVLAFLRWDLGKERFYDSGTFFTGGLSVLIIVVISFFIFRLVQRSDNKEIAQSGEAKAMYQLLAAVESSKSKELVAMLKLLSDAQGNKMPTVEDIFGEDDAADSIADEFFPPAPATPQPGNTDPVFQPVDTYGWIQSRHNGNRNGNGNGRH